MSPNGTDEPRGGPLDGVIVVLDEPQDVVNIAAVIRAMMNMGLSRLRLVRPAEFDPWRIEGIAHRSEDLVEGTEVLDDLRDAVSDAVHVVGTTARARTAQRNYVRPREAARRMVERAREGPVALVLGREDRGLSNEALDLCHEVVIVPTVPEYSSLNLAQAFLVLAYELFLASGADPGPLPRGKRSTRPPTREEMEEMYAALASGLARIDFFKARKPSSVIRTLRTLLARAEPDLRESRLVAAIGWEIGNHLDRIESRGEEEAGGDPAPGEEGGGGGRTL